MKNLYGMAVKDLVTTDDFGMILAEATTDALRKAGLDAELHLDRAASESVPMEETEGFAYVIGGKLSEVDIVSVPGWDTLKINAKVVIELYLSSGSHQEWIGPIEGTAERREIAMLTANSYTMALDTAMQNCMRNMIRHLRASGAMKAASD